jgi:uncharacterized paraquat-inducible protein A
MSEPAPDPTSTRQRPPLVGVLLGAALILNLAALVLPFVEIDAIGSDPWVYGLLGSVQMLWDSHMYALAVMVFTFSVLFPFAKIGALAWLWWYGVGTPRRHRVLRRVENLGKWSLFDVFLVAIMVALTNDQWLISSASLPGLTCFLIAVVLGMLAGEVLIAVVHQPATHQPGTHRRSGLLGAIVVACAVLLGCTLFVPFIQIDDWRLADRAYALAGLVPALWQNDSPVLAIALGAFVVAMPVVNLAVATVLVFGWWNRVPPPPALRVGDLTGRWSMLSVFALSLGVFLAEGHRFLGTQPKGAVWTLVIGLGLAWVGHQVVRRLWR